MREVTVTSDGGRFRQALLEIASKCPVHKTLSGTIRIESAIV